MKLLLVMPTGLQVGYDDYFSASPARHRNPRRPCAKHADVTLADMRGKGHDADAHAEQLLATGPDMIGLSVNSAPHTKYALALADAMKRRRPDLPLLMGGQQVTFLAEEMMAPGNVDAVIRGEGELTLTEILTRGDWRGVAGVSWRDGESVRHEPDRPQIEDLDTRPAAGPRPAARPLAIPYGCLPRRGHRVQQGLPVRLLVLLHPQLPPRQVAGQERRSRHAGSRRHPRTLPRAEGHLLRRRQLLPRRQTPRSHLPGHRRTKDRRVLLVPGTRGPARAEPRRGRVDGQGALLGRARRPRDAQPATTEAVTQGNLRGPDGARHRTAARQRHRRVGHVRARHAGRDARGNGSDGEVHPHGRYRRGADHRGDAHSGLAIVRPGEIGRTACRARLGPIRLHLADDEGAIAQSGDGRRHAPGLSTGVPPMEVHPQPVQQEDQPLPPEKDGPARVLLVDLDSAQRAGRDAVWPRKPAQAPTSDEAATTETPAKTSTNAEAQG